MKYLFMSLVGLMMSLPATGLANLDITTEEDELTRSCELSIDEGQSKDDLQVKTEDYYFNFGRTRIGDRKSAVFTLRNNSSIPIIVQDIDVDGEGFNGGDNCPRVLLRGDRCQVRATFRPRDQRRYEGQVDIELSGREDIRIHLRGRGVWWN